MNYANRFLVTYLLITLMMSGLSQAFGNDGAYTTSGNQLIPIVETDISVVKEVLSIVRDEYNIMHITVEYQFFNPGQDKTIMVGFEAVSPSGDVDATPINGEHPYIKDFRVLMNGSRLWYGTSIVADSFYIDHDTIAGMPLEEILKNDNSNYVDFNYVYFFTAHFKQGLNTLKHTYSFKSSNSVEFIYDLEYILTAANRWANGQIDDFTLNIDMGDFENFYLNQTFFDSTDHWGVNGFYKFQHDPAHPIFEDPAAVFVVKDGPVTFHKKNFHPKGELFLYSMVDYFAVSMQEFDIHGDVLIPYSLTMSQLIDECANAESYQVLRNLPYALRGYHFKTDYIQEYYERQHWYREDPKYTASLESITEDERKWLISIKSKWEAKNAKE